MKNQIGAFVLMCLASAFARAENGTWERLMQRANQLEAAGNFASAAATYEEAFSAAKVAGDQLQMGIALGGEAGANGELGFLMEAERDYCRALQLLEKSAGKESLIYAKLSTSLAWHYLDRGETRLAEEMIRPAVAIYEKSPLPPGDIRLAVALHCLADVELRLRQFDGAASILQRAMDIFAENPTQNRAHLAATSNSLAAVRARQGRREDAIALYQRAAALLEQDTTSYDQALVRVLNNLASEYQALGRIDDAEREYKHALELAREILGTDHMVYGRVLRNYSAMLQKNGRKKEGKALEAQSKVILADDARRNGKGMTVDVSALRQ